MYAVYIYNEHDAKQVTLKEKVIGELSEIVQEVVAKDYQEIKDFYRVRTTPAIIFIRDDLQGEQLLNVDEEQGKLRLALEAWKQLEEEEKNIHEMETYRIDFKVQEEIQTAVELIGMQLVQTKIQQKQEETTARSLGAELVVTKLELAHYKNNEPEATA
ncbi:hypothetical protein [Paenibacillus tundrae]|uniref:hypothetical protein n=1 Tax=Paenibacillus tundrae TaxID=528187 RepID=UPI0030D2E677